MNDHDLFLFFTLKKYKSDTIETINNKVMIITPISNKMNFHLSMPSLNALVKKIRSAKNSQKATMIKDTVFNFRRAFIPICENLFFIS
jgi:hypothetical protein